MKIKKIKVENFRSVVEAEIECTDFNVIVGQNNHGKTNFFEAIDWFYKGTTKGININDLKFNREQNREIKVEITFCNVQAGLKRMKNEKNKTALEKLIGDKDEIMVLKKTPEEKRKILIDGEEKPSPTGFENALLDFMPRFEYVHTKLYYDSLAKYSKTTPIGVMLSGVLTSILEVDEDYKNFQMKFSDLFENSESKVRIEFDKLGHKVKVYLEKQFPDCTKVKFEVSPPVFEDLLKNFETTLDDGIETTADEKGDGMQRALMLSIIQAYSDYRKEIEELGKTFIFLIDEAELHLHPTAQRNLKDVLLTLAKESDQVFINTHSSVLVADDDSCQTIFKAEKANKQTTILKISESEKHYVFYELLGGKPTDLLLPNNFLIVEGRSELNFLKEVISRFYGSEKKIQIVYAEGDFEKQKESMDGINKVFTPLFSNPIYREKCIILCDTPNLKRKKDFDAFKSAYKYLEANYQLFVIPELSLEEYYSGSWKKNTEEVRQLEKDRKKTAYATEVGKEITQEIFEKDMNVIYEALKKVWANSY